MFIFPISTTQFGVSYLFPGLLHRNQGSISLYDINKCYGTLVLFFIIDIIVISAALIFNDQIPANVLSGVFGLLVVLFFVKSSLLSKSKTKVDIATLKGSPRVAHSFYWLSHALMAFSFIYVSSLLIGHPGGSLVGNFGPYIFKSVQFIFWLIFSAPFVNFLMVKWRTFM